VFSFTILRRGVRAGYAKVNALGEEELSGAGVVKLSPIVALDSFDAGAKLSGGLGDEAGPRAPSGSLLLLSSSLLLLRCATRGSGALS